MALHAEFFNPSALAVSVKILRRADGLRYDFADGAFKTTPGTPLGAMTNGSGDDTGLASFTLTPTPQSQFSDGDYRITFHNTGNANVVVGVALAVMSGGDDSSTGVGLGFTILGGSTSTTVLLTVPSGGNYASWVTRKLVRLSDANEATINAVSLSGTTLTVTLGTGWTTPTPGDVAWPSA